jgi:hypothetical protein
MSDQYEEGTSRKYDLMMFAGYHLGWILKNGGTAPHVTIGEIYDMIDEYMGRIGFNKDTDDGDTTGRRSDASRVGETGEDTQ